MSRVPLLRSLTIEATTLTAGVAVYNYTAAYDAVGNVTQSTDTVMGTWTMTPSGGPSGYDSLNRLVSANITWPDSTQQIACFTYDAFGNRTMEALSTIACNSNPTPTAWAQFNGTTNGTNNNQMSATSQNPLQGAAGGYDLSGDITNDGINQYVYDAEGRICAVLNSAVPGMPIMTGYLYDADGTRVAKGTISTMSCDPTTSGFQFTENYVLGPGGEELTMMSGSNAWQRTNVYAGGKLLATYDLSGLHFHLEDALGTRRMQLSGELADLGQPETDIQSLPFGDQLNSFPDQYAPATADDATPLHFTGKERDTESGNDYFGARYYASSMGRFMLPDWSAKVEPVPYSKLDNPQTLNLYVYVGNNPLSRTDPTGHYVCSGSKEQCAQVQDGLIAAKTAMNNLGADSKEGKAIGQVLKFYGAEGEKNGVGVSFGKLAEGRLGETTTGANGTVNIKFDLAQISSFARGSGPLASWTERSAAEIHEGRHGVDGKAAGHGPENRHEELATERNAYRTQSYLYQGLGVDTRFGLWSPSWSPAEAEQNRNAAIETGAQRSTADACKQGCQP